MRGKMKISDAKDIHELRAVFAGKVRGLWHNKLEVPSYMPDSFFVAYIGEFVMEYEKKAKKFH